MRKIVLLILLMVAQIHAHTHEDEEVRFYLDDDYANSDLYTDSTFYENSDPHKWNLQDPNFKWEEALKNPKAYGVPALYTNLPKDQYKNVDYLNVNYDLIENHDDIDGTKFAQDHDCFQCVIEPAPGMKFSKGSIVHRDGGFVSIPGTYPDKTLFKHDGWRFIAVLPQDAYGFTPTPGDDITLSMDHPVFMSNGLTIDQGKAQCDQESCVVLPGDFLAIDDVLIGGLGQDNQMRVVVRSGDLTDDAIRDIRNKQQNTVFFDPDQRKVYAYSASQYPNKHLEIAFSSDNNYIPTNNHFGASIGAGGSLTIQERSFQDLVPLVTVQRSFENTVLYDTDHSTSQLEFDGRRIVRSGSELFSQSFSLRYVDSAGNNLLSSSPLIGTWVQRIGSTSFRADRIFLSGGEFYSVSSNLDSNFVSFRERLSYTQQPDPTLVFQKQYPHIQLHAIRKTTGKSYDYQPLDQKKTTRLERYDVQNPSDIIQVMSALEGLPPDILNSINGIDLFSSEDYALVRPRSGGYTGSDRIIRFPIRSINSPNMYHEGAHDLVFQIESEDQAIIAQNRFEFSRSEEGRKYNDKMKELLIAHNNLQRRLKDFNDYQIQPEVVALRNHMDAEPSWIKHGTFEQRWMKLTQGSHGFNLGTKDVAGNVEGSGRLSSTWSDGKRDPRYGCMSAYGCNNLQEDVAEYAEAAGSDPTKVHTMIKFSNPDKRYIQKYALLNEYGFLHDGWLAEMMDQAGYDQICIDAVTSLRGDQASCIAQDYSLGGT